MIYFDSAATTLQKPESVYAAVQRTMRACASVGAAAMRRQTRRRGLSMPAAPRQRSCSTPCRSRSFSP